MNLVVNIGNSRTKLAVFSEEEIKKTDAFNNADVERIVAFIQSANADYTIVSSTKNVPVEISAVINEPLHIDHTIKLPFTIDYDSRRTLGDDRLAAVAGAQREYKHADLLIITAGTCITYNIFTQNNVFLGGGISPGIDMRYKAMHHFTGKLPLATDSDFDELIGRSTIECLQSGVRQGIVAEMDGIISQYKLLYPKIQVLICGGTASFFERRTKNKIFAHPNLELIGMNELLMYNRKI